MDFMVNMEEEEIWFLNIENYPSNATSQSEDARIAGINLRDAHFWASSLKIVEDRIDQWITLIEKKKASLKLAFFLKYFSISIILYPKQERLRLKPFHI